MDLLQKNRTELKAYFKANDKPTEKQFADFMDASINQAEDCIVKEEGSPLAIQAEGGETGTQEVGDKVHIHQTKGVSDNYSSGFEGMLLQALT
ncbi:hypothetical protein [Ascidiimonas sp. W6]|uniref:hypothetical protein n=1 Tax=Ascidiimonas meishanensis TaxID=3128903 RepID=UPI0030ED4DC6